MMRKKKKSPQKSWQNPSTDSCFKPQKDESKCTYEDEQDPY